MGKAAARLGKACMGLECSKLQANCRKDQNKQQDLLRLPEVLVPSENRDSGLTFSFGPLKTKVCGGAASLALEESLSCDKRSTL